MVNTEYGHWAFILGVIIAIIAGLASGFVDLATGGMITIVLIVLGIIVGFININEKETQPFLIAAIAFMLVKTALSGLDIVNLGVYLTNIVTNIAAFVAPAALIVALKAIYKLAARPTV
ncbi:MAG: hypothetical protein ABIF08_03695 [Nanoarchaeota archaeon]